VGTVGSVAGPVEGAVVNPVVQTLKGLPVIGGPAGGVVDTVISTVRACIKSISFMGFYELMNNFSAFQRPPRT